MPPEDQAHCGVDCDDTCIHRRRTEIVNAIRITNPKFRLGTLRITAGAFELPAGFIARCLMRHANADWGDMHADDLAANDASLASHDGRLFSGYTLDPSTCGDCPDDKLWIITEADRSFTTIVLPSEY